MASAVVVVFAVFQIPCSGSLPLFSILCFLQGDDALFSVYQWLLNRGTRNSDAIFTFFRSLVLVHQLFQNVGNHTCHDIQALLVSALASSSPQSVQQQQKLWSCPTGWTDEGGYHLTYIFSSRMKNCQKIMLPKYVYRRILTFGRRGAKVVKVPIVLWGKNYWPKSCNMLHMTFGLFLL